MGARKEVEDLVALGPLPDESAEEDQLATHQTLLCKIAPPVSDEEAALLLELFGPDDCYGLAWTLLHLIESASGGLPLTAEPSNGDTQWLHLLWERSRR